MPTFASALILLFLLPQSPPDFDGVVWVDKAPDLKGKVALVRWWTNG